jgi:hypothetical protein
MADREMALAIGHYINELLEKISALEAVLEEQRITDSQARHVEIPWKEDVKRILQDPSFRRLSVGQSNALLQAIGDETQASALIRALCRNYFQT